MDLHEMEEVERIFLQTWLLPLIWAFCGEKMWNKSASGGLQIQKSLYL